MLLFETASCLLLLYAVTGAPAPGESQMKIPKDSEDSSEAYLLMDPAPIFMFGYLSDDGRGTTQHRHEESDGTGGVKGSYGYTDSKGVYRTVNYTADANGYRAEVRSNEPGFGARSTGDALYVQDVPKAGLKRKGKKGLRRTLKRPVI